MPRTGDASILSPWGRFCQSWKSTSSAIFLDQAVLPEPNDAREARGESHLRQAFPTGVATVCTQIASPAAICGGDRLLMLGEAPPNVALPLPDAP